MAGVAAEPAAGPVSDPDAARRVIERLAARGETIAVAESLTGGMLAAALVDVPGASAVLRGGVVAYATDLKHGLLGVDEDLLRDRGPVDGEVARQMAEGVRARLGATIGVATTGVAGPEPQGGHPPGEVWIGIASASAASAEPFAFTGDRAAVRAATVAAALERVLGVLRGSPE